MSVRVLEARDQLTRAVLRRLSAELLPASDPHLADEQELSDELIAHAARNLTRAVDGLPPEQQPIGWGI